MGVIRCFECGEVITSEDDARIVSGRQPTLYHEDCWDGE